MLIRILALLIVISVTWQLNCAKNGQKKVTAAYIPSEKWTHAIFAGGCFWCMEHPFEKLPGVRSVYSGYTGGDKKGPNYEDVSAGRTKHAEAVLIEYDPAKISFEKLLDIFWMNINPTQVGGQFYDIGHHYRTVIFYTNQEQKDLAEKSKSALEKSNRFQKPIVTEIEKAGPFWMAEEYHQDYYKKNPEQYSRYRKGSGRDDYLKGIWGDKK